jgi:hypothetical protein
MFFTHKGRPDYNKTMIHNNFEIDKKNKIKNMQIIDKFKMTKMQDFKRVNKKISLQENYSIEYIKNKNIKTITNVYQSKYNNDKNSSGFGDFIRGCYFLIEFCEKYDFEPKIIFNNCISNFLLTNSDYEKKDTNLSNINHFVNNNYNSPIIQNDIILYPKLNSDNIISDFIYYLYKTNINDNNSFVYCTSYPLIENVSDKSKEMIRTILQPNDTIRFCVHETLNRLQLEYNNYSVFHVRSGDKYLNNSTKFPRKYIEKLKTNITIFIKKNEKYLLIADNNQIKILLKKYFPNINILLKEITHFGEGVLLEEEKVKNTLIDFYMLSFSKKIFCFTCYEHGSGFSYWCAKTYNIPYIVKLIQ